VDLQPPASPGVPTLVNAGNVVSDTGIFNNDYVTNNLFPTFRFDLPRVATNAARQVIAQYAATAGMVFELRSNATTVIATVVLTQADIDRGFLDIQPQTALAANRTYSDEIRGVLIDQAGNASSTDSTWVLPFLRTDTTAPTVPYGDAGGSVGMTLTINSDSGRSDTDGVTSQKTGLSFRGINSLDALLLAFKLTRPDGTVTDLGQMAVSGYYFTYTYNGSPLADGSYQITAQAIDQAGNVSAQSVAYFFRVDSSVPAVPAPVSLRLSDDTGLITTDLVTRNATALVFNGVADLGANVRLVNASGVVLAQAIAHASTGLYSFTGVTLSEGSHALRVQQDNLAGTWSQASAPLAVTVDRTPPVRSTVEFMQSDSRTPTLRGTYDHVNTRELLVRINDVVYATEAGKIVRVGDTTDRVTVAGLQLDSSAGTWSLDIPQARELSAGTLYNVQVLSSDLAGNSALTMSRDQVLVRPLNQALLLISLQTTDLQHLELNSMSMAV
jgi:hypothetical protein